MNDDFISHPSFFTILMLARFDWQWRFGASKKKLDRPSRLSYRVGGVFLGGLTAVYLIWLILHYGVAGAGFAALPAVLFEMVQLLEMAGAVTLIALWAVWLWQWKRPLSLVQPNSARDLNELYDLSPKEFEQYVARLFRKKGYKVSLRGASGDKGVDLMLERAGGRRAIVQCKRYRRPVGPEVVRELFGTLIHERVSHAFLVTTADISQSARDWAQGKPMTLIDGNLLIEVSHNLMNQD
jgi:HJR/Mrr/RecB family endonuclease